MKIDDIYIWNLTFYENEFNYHFIVQCSGLDDKKFYHSNILLEFYIFGEFTTEQFENVFKKAFNKKVNQKD